MTDLSRHPSKSTEELAAIDSWYEREHATLMASETLTPPAKKQRLEELRKEYADQRLYATDAARKDLAEWEEIFQSRAESAYEPKMPTDKDARILKALELQRLHNRLERNRDKPGVLLAEYEKAVRAGDDVIAHELAEALPDLLEGDTRHEFTKRVRKDRIARMSEDDKKKVAEYEAFKKEKLSVEQGLSLQEMARQSGFVPGQPQPTMLTTHHQPGRPPQVDEVVNTSWRDPSQDQPVNEPVGGTIAPSPGSAA